MPGLGTVIVAILRDVLPATTKPGPSITNSAHLQNSEEEDSPYQSMLCRYMTLAQTLNAIPL